MKLSLLIFTSCLGFCLGIQDSVREYSGYQVYSINITNLNEYQVVQKLQGEFRNEVDFWKRPQINRTADVMVAPKRQSYFQAILDKNGLTYRVKVNDVQMAINSQKVQNSLAMRRSIGHGKIGWNYYARYTEIEEFIKQIVQDNQDIASYEVIGQSFEKRDLYAVKISTSPDNKNAMFIDANIHAREWITSATATWILNELLTKRSTRYLTEIDWYIIPMVNPDGYEYTHTHDRTWRKTRSINGGSGCRGCDPNRNFPFQFGGEGTSSNPCSNNFKGPTPLSETEAEALANFMQKVQDHDYETTAYISFHSYGQLWLLSWGYTSGAHPDDFADQESLGHNVVSAIYGVDGTLYESGAGADILYGVGGASDDYAKAIGFNYSVTAEMRDAGAHGFLLPPDQIEINAQEIFSGLREVVLRLVPRDD